MSRFRTGGSSRARATEPSCGASSVAGDWHGYTKHEFQGAGVNGYVVAPRIAAASLLRAFPDYHPGYASIRSTGSTPGAFRLTRVEKDQQTFCSWKPLQSADQGSEERSPSSLKQTKRAIELKKESMDRFAPQLKRYYSTRGRSTRGRDC